MDTELAQKAISLALKGCWKEAIATNQEILKVKKDDVDALNRLARAYSEVGNLTKAKKTAQNVLKIDPFNSIATRSLEKWKDLKKGETYTSHPSSVETFLEEPGKTKICSLLFLGDKNTIGKLDSADEVKIDTHSHRLSICTLDNKYIGRLPDDLSARLKKLIKLGNEYCVFIKSIDKGEVKVFIKETKREKKISDIPSFSAEKVDYITFTPPELIHDKAELNDDDEDGDS